jgi:glycosyltransferase involved in cell wall biosynthesis
MAEVSMTQLSTSESSRIKPDQAKPLVSCIIIFFNAKRETFFEEAIESILAQTYDQWELILADDGSTDASTAISQRYAQTYPDKVRYVEHEGHQNRGRSATRNLGIRHARGEFIAFLDADDIWLPQKLEKQVAILEAHPEVEMVYGSTKMWHGWTGHPDDARLDRHRKLGVPTNTVIQPPELLTLFLKRKAEAPGICALLIRRKAVEQVGCFEENFEWMFDDQAFLAKVCLRSTVFVESGSWDLYRQHPHSSCHIAEQEGFYNPLQPNSAESNYFNWLEEYFSEQHVQDQTLWRALNGALFPYRNPRLFALLNVQYWKRHMKKFVKSFAQATLPPTIQARLKAYLKGTAYIPPVDNVKFGSLRRVLPISQQFGYDRGLPIDRYYIEGFLNNQASDIQGRVLEIGDNSYTQEFGGSRVTQSDILHVSDTNPNATIVGDLSNADYIPSDTFDCLILTQTLHLILEVEDAIKTIHRILKPGGVALITVPGISQISVDEWKDYWCWSFTRISAQRLFEKVFLSENIKVETYGNVLVAIAFLQGLAAEELSKQELDFKDPSYQVLLTVRVTKPLQS